MREKEEWGKAQKKGKPQSREIANTKYHLVRPSRCVWTEVGAQASTLKAFVPLVQGATARRRMCVCVCVFDKATRRGISATLIARVSLRDSDCERERARVSTPERESLLGRWEQETGGDTFRLETSASFAQAVAARTDHLSSSVASTERKMEASGSEKLPLPQYSCVVWIRCSSRSAFYPSASASRPVPVPQPFKTLCASFTDSVTLSALQVANVCASRRTPRIVYVCVCVCVCVCLCVCVRVRVVCVCTRGHMRPPRCRRLGVRQGP